MSEKEDQIIQLLKEIRDIGLESSKRAQEVAASAKKQSEDYAASLLKHQERQDACDLSQVKHKKEMFKAGIALKLFLGIIAICSVIRLVLLIGR